MIKKCRKSCWTLLAGKVTLPVNICLVFVLFASTSRSVSGGDNSLGDLSIYFPIAADLEWEYEVHENNKCFSQQVTCATVVSDSQFMLCTKSVRRTRYFFHIREGKVWLAHIDVKLPILPFQFTITLTPELPIFCFNKSFANDWTWNGEFSSLLSTKRANIHTHISGVEQLLVDNRYLDCLRLDSEITVNGKTDKLTAWYAAGYGLVKQASRRQKKVLVKFNQQKESLEFVAFKSLKNENFQFEPNIDLYVEK